MGSGTITIETANLSVDEAFCRSHPDAGPGDYVVLAVTDDGRGMPPEVQERSFGPFFTTKPQGMGTGLGLAAVYGIVRQNGGFISINSTVGSGTTFRIHLPRYRGEASEESAALREAPFRLRNPAADGGRSGAPGPGSASWRPPATNRPLFLSGYPAGTISIIQDLPEREAGFLQKPFTRTDLLRKVRNLLDARDPAEGRPPSPGSP